MNRWVMEGADSIFNSLHFKHSWRDYQQRILHELDAQLDDDHLHVVAAPGSGKTVLGIEVVRRLAKPSLILAPNLTIRNQWVDRIQSLFLPKEVANPEWISTDLRRPKIITIITYQALFSAFTNKNENEVEEGDVQLERDQEKDVIINRLNNQGISTIVLDEAHHLRKEWWKSLIELKESLEHVTVVSLTATPPYDVSFREWQRYEALCGPIDAEISVPELVKNGDLCPHQDYVYLSTPTPIEGQSLDQFKDALGLFLRDLSSDEEFLSALSTHEWIQHPEEHIEDILGEPRYFSSMVIFLHACGIEMPGEVLGILGVKKRWIPRINEEWMEVLLTGVLYDHPDQYAAYEDKLDAIRVQLKRIGAVERRKINLSNTRQLQKILASSLSKLESIYQITQIEANHLEDRLRQVILIDFIRKEELPRGREDIRPINKLGVVPIFEYLRRKSISGIRVGVLTGSFVLVPREAKPVLVQAAKDMNIAASHIKFLTLPHDENYLRVEIAGEHAQKVVQLITIVFSQGAITVLVGTQALLGEGWDAPSINTLILASNVGSYVLSNQMRGRAIRIDPEVPDKVANIWHLASLETHSLRERIVHVFYGSENESNYPETRDIFDGHLGKDVEKLETRFKAFEGLTNQDPATIKNGFDRLGFSASTWSESVIQQLNRDTLERAQYRDQLHRLWSEALMGKSQKPRLRKMVQTGAAPNGLMYIPTLKYFALNALLTGITLGAEVLNLAKYSQDTFLIVLGAAGCTAIYTIPKLAKAGYIWFKNGSLEGSISQVARVVLECLLESDLMQTASADLSVNTFKDRLGMAHCSLDGATRMEQKYFLEAMQEILSPVENPRYVLVRQSWLGFIERVDYHAVPTLFGQKKETALLFAKKWNRYVSDVKLVFTRSKEGRKTLLKARLHALSAKFQHKADRLNEWM